MPAYRAGSKYGPGITERENFRREAQALDANLGKAVLNLLHVFGCQAQVNRADIFLEVGNLRRAGDRHDKGLAGKQPAKGYLPRRCTVPLPNAFKQFDDRIVCLDGFRREPLELEGHPCW